jgi:hypothetical protein
MTKTITPTMAPAIIPPIAPPEIPEEVDWVGVAVVGGAVVEGDPPIVLYV